MSEEIKIEAQPPVDNEHVAEGATPFSSEVPTPEEVVAEAEEASESIGQ